MLDAFGDTLMTRDIWNQRRFPRSTVAMRPGDGRREMMVRKPIHSARMDLLSKHLIVFCGIGFRGPVVDHNGVFRKEFSEKICMRFVVSISLDGMRDGLDR